MTEKDRDALEKKQKASRDRELKRYIKNIKDESEHRAGRPLSLTWDMLAEIKVLLSEGQFQKYVYLSLGIKKTTWESWKQKGHEIDNLLQNKELKYKEMSDEKRKYLYLVYIVDKSKEKAIMKNVRIIEKAAERDWRAARWYLEVVDRDTFGEKIEATVHGEVTMKRIVEKYKERIAQAENE